MKKNTILATGTNPEPQWALVNEKGEIVETFYRMDTLRAWRSKLERDYMCELKVKWIGG